MKTAKANLTLRIVPKMRKVIYLRKKDTEIGDRFRSKLHCILLMVFPFCTRAKKKCDSVVCFVYVEENVFKMSV